ncbi:MAG: aromatic amino acid transport family protein [Candidatus Pacebacteria bacterium]|nr:aromatic amino acid transport family protein [Candidatus Paceibacterota bacterium]
MTPFLKALAILIATIIGVGIFGLPFVASKSGFILFSIYVLVILGVAIISHLMYAKVCLATPGKKRFPGYVKKYIGPKTAKFSMVAMCIGMYGAQLAYLIVGGQFFYNLLSPYLGGNILLYTFIYFVLASILIYTGIKGISIVEFFVVIIFAIIVITFVARLMPLVDVTNLAVVNTKSLFLPYGIVLFALWGSSIIPEMEDLLGKKKKLLNRIIVIGLSWAALVYLVFSGSVVGFCGKNTTNDTFSCLTSGLGGGIVRIGYLLGAITCFSSFVLLGLTVKKSFHYDYKWPIHISWAAACIVPFLLYVAGLKNYINIIGMTGAVTIGIEGVLSFFLFKKVSEKLSKKVMPWHYIPLIVLIIGLFLEISNFFKK